MRMANMARGPGDKDVEAFEARLAAGEVLVLDGGIGTELERRGIPETSDASWAECMADHGDAVRAVHVDYIRAGADIITTNTYSSGPSTLAKLGKVEFVEAWNLRAVELVREAVAQAAPKRPLFIAGSVSSYGNGAMATQSADGKIAWAANDTQSLADSFRDQAQILASAGVDLILLELLCATRENTAIALDAVKQAGLPVVLSLSGTIDAKSGAAYLQTVGSVESADDLGAPFGSAVADLADSGVAALLAMHSEIGAVPALLAALRSGWHGPIGVYPNRTGYWDGGKWVFVEELTADVYGALADDWIARGAQIVGGCCGIGPHHIEAVRQVLERKNAASVKAIR